MRYLVFTLWMPTIRIPIKQIPIAQISIGLNQCPLLSPSHGELASFAACHGLAS